MDAIKAYIDKIKRIPLLTALEEKSLTRKAKKGNRDARRKLINSNLKLVINIAKHYVYFDIPMIDLIAEGNIGLMRAIDKFNPNKGYRFSTYAAWWIRQAITRSIIDQGKTIRIPVYMSELINKFKRCRETLRQKLKREPSDNEIAKTLKIDSTKISEIAMWTQKKTSLDMPVGEEGISQLSDFLDSDDYTDTSSAIEKVFDKEQTSYLLDSGFINDREKIVLDLRFGISDGKSHTLSEIAHILKLSRERVRQIESSALDKLKKYVIHE